MCKRLVLIFCALCCRYDPTSGAYYYINNVNGDTMWERPSFMNYLFPQSKW